MSDEIEGLRKLLDAQAAIIAEMRTPAEDRVSALEMELAEARAEIERLRGLLLEVRAPRWKGDLHERIVAALDAEPVAYVNTALNHPANCSIYDSGRCTCGKAKP